MVGSSLLDILNTVVHIYYYNEEYLERYSNITVKILENQFFNLKNIHSIEKNSLELGICNTLN